MAHWFGDKVTHGRVLMEAAFWVMQFLQNLIVNGVLFFFVWFDAYSY